MHIEFYTADWCRRCDAMRPIINNLSAKYDVPVKEISLTDDNMAQYPTIMTLPTIFIKNDNEMVKAFRGIVHKKNIEIILKEGKKFEI